MNKEAIFRLEENIVGSIARQRLVQVDADHLQLSILGSSENLRVGEERVGCSPTGEVNRVAQVRGAIRNVVAGIAYLTRDCDFRRVFKLETAEYTDRVKRLQNQVLIFARKRIIQVERQHRGAVIGRVKANDFCMLLVWLGKDFVIRL